MKKLVFGGAILVIVFCLSMSVWHYYTGSAISAETSSSERIQSNGPPSNDPSKSEKENLLLALQYYADNAETENFSDKAIELTEKLVGYDLTTEQAVQIANNILTIRTVADTKLLNSESLRKNRPLATMQMERLLTQVEKDSNDQVQDRVQDAQFYLARMYAKQDNFGKALRWFSKSGYPAEEARKYYQRRIEKVTP